MKISVHTDVLVELAEVVHGEGPEAGKAWLDHPESEFWSPALLMAGAYETLASKYGTAIARECLQFIQGQGARLFSGRGVRPVKQQARERNVADMF